MVQRNGAQPLVEYNFTTARENSTEFHTCPHQVLNQIVNYNEPRTENVEIKVAQNFRVQKVVHQTMDFYTWMSNC